MSIALGHAGRRPHDPQPRPRSLGVLPLEVMCYVFV